MYKGNALKIESKRSISMEKRSIPVAIILTIVTCGIYGIYWYYKTAETFYNAQTSNGLNTSPIVTILLSIVTCGIYGIYAYYVWGKAMPEIFARYGFAGEDRSVMYIILSIFGFSIINMALIQNDFNILADSSSQQPPYQQPPTV